MKLLPLAKGLTRMQLFTITALVIMTLAGLLLIAAGVGLITGYWTHFEDGSGVIGGELVKIVYCNPFDICAR